MLAPEGATCAAAGAKTLIGEATLALLPDGAAWAGAGTNTLSGNAGVTVSPVGGMVTLTVTEPLAVEPTAFATEKPYEPAGTLGDTRSSTFSS